MMSTAAKEKISTMGSSNLIFSIFDTPFTALVVLRLKIVTAEQNATAGLHVVAYTVTVVVTGHSAGSICVVTCLTDAVVIADGKTVIALTDVVTTGQLGAVVTVFVVIVTAIK